MALKRFKERVAMDYGCYTDDMLSNMPESLQLRILSRLDARQVVQTLVLSKSWVSLWTRIPVLNFNSRGFDCFVLNVLSRRQSVKLDKLTFKHVGDFGDEISQVIFDYAFSHGVEELEANVQDIKIWPTGSSDSLTSLKFTSGSIVGCSFSSVKSFKNLTNLYLKGVTIADLDPFSEFPALEKLRLDFCPITTEGNALNVHAPQLSEFTILYYYKQFVRRLVIDFNAYCRQEQERIMFDDLLMLFNPLSNARSLTLFSPVVYILTLFPLNGSTPHFPKLKFLKLDLGSFRNPELFQRPCGSLLELSKLVPCVRDYLLPKSHDGKWAVCLSNDDIGAQAFAILKGTVLSYHKN